MYDVRQERIARRQTEECRGEWDLFVAVVLGVLIFPLAFIGAWVAYVVQEFSKKNTHVLFRVY